VAIERRFSASLNDLEVVLICKKCGARIGYSVLEWNSVPGKCPNCPQSSPGLSEPDQRIELLRMHFRTAIHSAAKLPFEIRVEFIDPREKSSSPSGK
jgi:hypothetical protein